MKNFSVLVLTLIVLAANSVFSQNAPVSTLGTVVTTATSTIVPITGTGINNVGSCNLLITYNQTIGTPTNVTVGPLLGGTVSANLSIPGQIILGWFTSTGMTIPDGSVLFNIEFNKVTAGTTPLAWSDDGYSCAWYDIGNNLLNDSPTSTYYLDGSLTFQNIDAPKTTLAAVNSCAGVIVDVPVTVEDFINIGAYSLTLNYSTSALTYYDAVNNAGFPAFQINGSVPGIVVAGGFSLTGIDYPDNTVLFTLQFTYSGGHADLTWFDDGGSCEYQDPDGLIMNDSPFSSFYFNGTVDQIGDVGVPVFSLGATSDRCQGAGTVSYAATSANASGITYTLDATSLLAGNTIDENTGEVTYVAGWFGTSVITATAQGCNGPQSANHTVTVNPTLPVSVSISNLPDPVFVGNSVTFTATPVNPGAAPSYQWFVNSLPVGADNPVYTYTPAEGDAIYCVLTSNAAPCATGSPATSNTITIHFPTAPNTIAPDVTSCAGVVIDVPVTVNNFTGIGAVSLTMNYNPAVLQYVGATNNTPFPLSTVGSTPGIVTTGGYTSPGETYPDNTILYTLHFMYLGGSTPLEWFDNGISCEYEDGNNNILYDLPFASFYQNGSVTQIPDVTTPIFSEGSSTERCQGAGSVMYDASASNATSITYSLDAASLLAGNTIDANTGEVTYVAGWSGVSYITVVAEGCNGPKSAIHTATTNPTLPVSITISNNPDPVFVGNTVTFTAAPVNPGPTPVYQWYVNSLPVGTNDPQYTYTPAEGDEIYCILDSDAYPCATGSPATSNTITIHFPTAPNTIAPDVTSCSGVVIDVPVTVNNFTGIGAVSLTMNYNPAVLQYVGATNNTPFPLSTVGSTPGIVTTGGYTSPGETYPDNTILYTLHFMYLGGSTPLEWFDNGISCEYEDGNNNILYDLPFATFYQNGSVTQIPDVTTPVFSEGSNTERCQGAGSVMYDASASNATSITYSLDAASLLAGNTIDANTGEVTYVAGWSGVSYITVVAEGCNGPKSAIHTATTNPTLPVSITISNNPDPVFVGNTVTFTAAPVNPGPTPVYQWYVNSLPVGTNDPQYTYTPAEGDEIFCILNSDAYPCATGSPATSNTITIHFVTAPNTIAPDVTSCSGVVIDVPVTVNNFTDIGAVSLTMTYNPAVLQYVGATNNTPFPLSTVGSTPGIVTTGGYTSPGETYPNNTVLYTLHFLYLGGTTQLEWFDNGISCEYEDGNNNILYDLPFASFYQNGSVTQIPDVTIPVFSMGATSERCQGAGVVTYTATASNATGITYSLDAASLLAGNTIDSNTGEVTYVAGWSGTTIITASAEGCNGPLTAAHTVTVNPSIPVSVTIANNPDPVFVGNLVTFTATPVNPGTTPSYQWYVNGSPMGTSDPVFAYTPAEGDQVYCILNSSASPCAVNNPATSNTITIHFVTAPNTIAPDVTACIGGTIDVPITVNNFTNIGAVSLTLNYNPAVLLFVGATNNTPFPLSTVGTTPGIVTTGGYTSPGETYPNNTVLYTLHFTYLGGFSALTWYDDGISCEYEDGDHNILYDLPFASFYQNGSVTQSINPPPVLVITNPDPVCEPNTIDLTAPAVTAGSTLYGATLSYWMDAAATIPMPTPATAGNGIYYILATTSEGCTDIEPVTATVNPLPVAEITPSGPTTFCDGGSVDLTASGGTNFLWSNGSTLATISVNTAGTYSVTVTNVYGCNDSESVLVSVNPLPTAVITPGGPTTFCDGGSVDLTASGGILYNWSTGSTDATITVTTTGNYSVTVTDGNGCSDSETMAVIVNPILPVSVSIAADVFPVPCASTVTFTASPVNGGSMPSYQWFLNGMPVGSNSPVYSYSPLPHDQVYCIMTSNETCISGSPATSNTISVLISNSAPVTTIGQVTACANLISIPVTVSDFNNVGSISLTMQYNSAVLSFQGYTNTSGFPGLSVSAGAPGLITAGGFSAGAGISYPDNTVLFTMDFLHTGGSTALTWFDNGISCEYADFPLYNPMCDVPTSYYYINGQVNEVLPQNILKDPNIAGVCQNVPVAATFTGGSGGNSPVDYYESTIDGGLTWSPYIPGNPLTSGIAGTSRIQVRTWRTSTGMACSQTPYNTVSWDVYETIGGAVTPDATVCAGTNSTLLTLAGHTGAVLNWESSADGLIWNTIVHTDITYTATNLTSSTMFRAVVQDGACNPAASAAATITVVQPEPVSVSVVASGNPVCIGSSVTFTATPVNGGTTPSYQWFVNSLPVGTDNFEYTYIPADGDQVYCVMTSNYWCVSGNPATSNTIVMTVTPLQLVGVTINASLNPSLGGTPVTFTATPVNGGATPSYQWYVNGLPVGTDNPAYTYVPANNDQVYCVMTSSETYCITGNPATSNTIVVDISNSAPITTLPVFTACSNLISIPVTVSDFNNVGSISLTMLYNASALQFQGFTNTSGFPGLSFSASTPGTITGGGFSASAGIFLPDNTVLFTLEFLHTGGTSSLNWFDNGISCEYADYPSYNPMYDLPQPTYYIDGQVNEVLAQTIVKDPDVSGVCQNVTVSATFTGGSGGNSPVDYYESSVDGGATWLPYTPGTLLSSVVPGTARIQVRTWRTSTGMACAQTPYNTATWDVYETIGGAVTPDNSVCSGINSTLLTLSGHSGNVLEWQSSPDGIAWSPIANTATTYTATDLNATTLFRALVQDGACNPAVSTPATITVIPTLAVSVSISASVNPVCAGPQVQFTAFPVNGGTTPSYQWYVNGMPVGTNSTDFAYIPANNDQVTCVLTSSETCTSGNPATSNTILMTVFDGVAISGAVTNVTCAGGSDGAIDITVTSGTLPYTYSWSNGASSEDLTGLTAGTYTVTVTDANSCFSSESFIVLDGAVILPNAIVTNVNCRGESNGSINLSVSGGTAPYDFVWNTGEITEDIEMLFAGDYTVTITDAHNCMLIDSWTVNEPSDVSWFGSVQNVTCYGANNGFIQGNTLGGSPPYTYAWSNGATDENIYNLPGGVYYLTVTDTHGCNAITWREVIEPAELIINPGAIVVPVSCNGGSDGSIDITVSGGTPPYLYSWSNGSTDQDLSGLVAGTYAVTVTDDHLCTTTGNWIVGQPDLLTLTGVVTNVSCNNGSNGAIDITVGGGTMPYSYLWSNGATSEDLSGLSAGTYSVVVTDLNNCSATENFTVTQPDAISISGTVTYVICGTPGSIDLTVTGGMMPYSFLWSNGAVTEDINGLSAGTYTVVVTDFNSCQATESYTVLEIAGPAVTAAVTNVNCNGGMDGAIDLTLISGTSPYQFEWSTGETTEDIGSLFAGTYTVTITDANSCSMIDSWLVTEPSNVTWFGSISDVSCHGGNNGFITGTTLGGTPPYTYLWSNGATDENIYNLTAGTYYLTVTDAHGCDAIAFRTIGQPAELIIEPGTIVTPVSCYGGTNGAIDISLTGGTMPYSYLWNNGATSEDIYNLAAGCYTVTITDANACTTTGTWCVSQPDELNLFGIVDPVNCFGGSDATILFSVSGGTPGYTYLWSNGSTNEDLYGLSAGTYTVTVTDSHGCTGMKDFTVTQPDALALSAVITNVICGQPGAIDLTVSGGSYPYNYLWSNGATSEDISGLSAGTYTVTVRDDNNCETSESYTLTESPGIVATAVVTNVNCTGGQDGAIDVTVTGGALPYQFEWNTGETTEDIANLFAGDYTITVTDGNNCVLVSEWTVNEPSNVSWFGSVTNVTCNGGANGFITGTTLGGSPPYTYYWSNGATDENIFNLPAGVYYLTVTDSHGCDAKTFREVLEPAALVIQPGAIVVPAACNGGATGSIDITVSGGTLPYTYLWNNGATTEDITGLAAGWYTVTVTDANTCSTSGSWEVTQPEAITVTGIVSPVLCNGGATGAIDITAAGGTLPYTYLWSNGATSEDISGLSAGQYTVIITDINSCTGSEMFTVTEPDLLLITGNQVVDASCLGSCNGSISITVAGGTAPYSYLWSNGAMSEDIVDLCAGCYTVIITDANNCTTTGSWCVAEPSAVDVTGVASDVTCFGLSNGAVDITVIGGTPGYTYLWSNGETSEDISGLSAGTYAVTVTDSHGCQDGGSWVITQPDELIVTGTVVNAVCGVPGSITTSVTGGTSPYSYLWSNGETTSGLNGLLAGIYTLTVTDIKGCQDVEAFTVTELPGMEANAVVTNVNCNGGQDGAIDLTVTGGTAPYQFEWNTGETTEDIADLFAGPYTVTVTDVNACTLVANWTVNEPSNVSWFGSVTNVTCYAGTNGFITGTTLGGSPPYTYLWSNGATDENIFNLPAGIYHLTVTDSHGCDAKTFREVLQPAELVIEPGAIVVNIPCFGGNSGSIDITVTGGTLPYNYLWSNGATTEDISGLIAGTYSVVVTDGNQCMTTGSWQITQPDALTLNGVVTDLTCSGTSTGAIDITVGGGTTPYSFIWSNGAVTEDLSGLPGGTYTVTVTDANSCTISDSWVVNEPPFWTIGITGPAMVCCENSTTNTTAIYNAVVSGTFAPPVTYQWAIEGGIILNGQNSPTIEVLWSCCGTGKVWLTVNQGNPPCALTTFIPVVITTIPTPVITGPVTVYSNTSGSTYCTPYVAGHLYSWSVVGGTIVSGQGTNCITVDWGNYPACGCGQVTVCESSQQSPGVVGCTACTTLDIVLIPNPANVNLEGYVTYDNGAISTPLNNVVITLKNGSGNVVGTVTSGPNMTTGEPGYYAFTNIPNGTYSLSATSTSAWGGNNATDALIIQLNVLGSYPLYYLRNKVADVNQSLSISGLDALYVKLRTVHMINSYPAGDWKFTDTTFTFSGTAVVNLKGLCVGDVNGSFIPSGMKETTSVESSSDGILRVPVGQIFDYSVKIDRNADLGAMTLFMGYDDSRFEITEVISNNDGLKYRIDVGRVELAWSDVVPMSLNANDQVVTFRMMARTAIDEPTGVFTILPGSEFADPMAGIYHAVGLKFADVTTAGAALELSMYNYPNPFRTATEIVYTLPEEATVTLTVTDMLGKPVATLEDGAREAGTHRVSVIPGDLNLVPGVYFYRIEVETAGGILTKVNRMIYTK